MAISEGEKPVSRIECDLKHRPIESLLIRLDKRMNWFYILVISTLFSVLINMGINLKSNDMKTSNMKIISEASASPREVKRFK